MSINQEKSKLDEILGQQTSPKPEVKKPQNSRKDGQILDERCDFKMAGFQDGIFMSADYQEGFVNGLAQGIAEARHRTLKALNKSFKANREKTLQVNYDSREFENTMRIEPLSGIAFFALPPSNNED
jgi:flagellar biosynthesis/type III secretory pathway protein FliH